MGRMNQGWLVGILMAQLTVSSGHGAIISPNNSHPTKIAVIGSETTKPLELAKNRTVRWLENLDSVDLNAEALPVSYSGSEFALLKLERKLKELIAEIGMALSQGDSLQKFDLDIQAIQSDRELLLKLGNLWQRVLALKALAFSKTQERAKARETISEALKLHPDGVLEVGLSSDVEGLVSLEKEILKIQPQMVSQCSVDVRTLPEVREILVNGFSITNRSHVSLWGPSVITVALPGYESLSRFVSCDRPGSEMIQANLKKLPTDRGATIRDLANRWDSIVLLERTGEDFQYFLYSDGASIEEVATSSTPSVSEILERPLSDELPIQKDQFASLIQRHRWASTEPGFELLPNYAVGASEMVETSKWYNNWVFWAISGAVITGGLIWVLGGDGSQPSSNAQPTGITISID